MKKNSKIALMLVGASLLGSATTLVGESALRSAGYDVDTYIPNKESANMDDSFVRTASSRSAAMSSGIDFTVVAENTINSVVSIKSFVVPFSCSRSVMQVNACCRSPSALRWSSLRTAHR